MSRRKGTMVGEVIRQYLDDRHLEDRIAQASVVNEWDLLVGKQLAQVSRPEFVDASGTLWVRVKSAAWIQELQMMSPMIIRDLARKGKRFRRIRWLAGDLQRPGHRRQDGRVVPSKEGT